MAQGHHPHKREEQNRDMQRKIFGKENGGFEKASTTRHGITPCENKMRDKNKNNRNIIFLQNWRPLVVRCPAYAYKASADCIDVPGVALTEPGTIRAVFFRPNRV